MTDTTAVLKPTARGQLLTMFEEKAIDDLAVDLLDWEQSDRHQLADRIDSVAALLD